MSLDYTTHYNYRHAEKHGPKPTHDQLSNALAITRQVVKRSVFGDELYLLALMLRPEGTSMANFKSITKAGNAFNKVRAVWRAGLITINGQKADGISLGQNIVMQAELTARGQKAAQGFAYEPTAAPKAKAKKRPSKPRKPATVPATVSEPVAEPVANPPVPEPVA